MALERLPHSAATKAKIAEALRGRARPPAVRAKIAASLTGHKHSDATKAKLSAARAKVPEAREVTRARRIAESEARLEQWRKDKYAAVRQVKDLVLLADVVQSQGWRCRRRLFDATKRVSDGFGRPRKRRLEDIRLDIYFQAQEYAYGIPRNR